MREREEGAKVPTEVGSEKISRRRFLHIASNSLFAIGAGFGLSSIYQSHETSQINGQLDDIYPLVRNLNKFAHEETRTIIKARGYELERQRAISILIAFQRLGVSAASIILARKFDE